MQKKSLHHNWTFRSASPGVGYLRPNQPANPWRPATVPGHVHVDLARAGVIADPFLLEYEAGAQWVSDEDWVYRTTFQWSPDSRLPHRVLRFNGLDTIAQVRLNGEVIAESDNMFLPVEVDVSSRLQDGANEIEVTLLSPVRVGGERRKAFFESEGIAHATNFFDERSFVRKAQYMSGWDWGPRLPSAGIWQPVELLEYASRIVSFTVHQESLPNGRFRVWSETEVEGDASLETVWNGETFAGDFDKVIDDPILWWPVGEGEPHLYDCSARLSTGDEKSKRIGLRTIRLLQEPDELGTSFEFEVNGRRIYVRGANWIPNDSFPSRVTREDYYNQVRVCAELNMNMLRVWGGGLYELEDFYDACDEYGILVWQDFPYGCSYYPDGETERAAAAREAEHHVLRLRDRTSLAIWCGNNENDVMWESKWGGPELSPPRYCGDDIYETTLAEVCRRLDPIRPYIRSSPIGGQKDDKAWGDVHYWDVWHGRGDWAFYADSLTRFSSEFGFASSCNPDGWRLAGMEPAIYGPHDSAVVWHDKTNKPHETFVGYVELHYPESRDLQDWIYYSQLNQRDALRFGIEHYRTNPYCRGTLIWQFNDCWPVQCWAVQDYSRQLKIAGFEMRRLYAPLMVSLRPVEDGFEVWLANDGPNPFEGEVVAEFLNVGGCVLKTATYASSLGSGERQKLGSMGGEGLEPTTTVLRAQVAGLPETATWRTLAEPKDMNWEKPTFRLHEASDVEVIGLAYDLLVLDPDLNVNVRVGDSDEPGLRAICAANETIRLQWHRRPRRLVFCSLAGAQMLHLGEELPLVD